MVGGGMNESMQVAFMSQLVLRLCLLVMLSLQHLSEIGKHLALSPDELGHLAHLSLQLIDLATHETHLQRAATARGTMLTSQIQVQSKLIKQSTSTTN